MRTLHRVTRGVRALFTRAQDDAELGEELRAFFEASVAAGLADGMNRADAVLLAPLPYPHGERIQQIRARDRDGGAPRMLRIVRPLRVSEDEPT